MQRPHLRGMRHHQAATVVLLMGTAAEYNAAQLASGALTAEHVTELVKAWQAGVPGLVVDGKAGPATIASLLLAAVKSFAVELGNTGTLRIADHWLIAPNVTAIGSHASWFGGVLDGGKPSGIVCHYTATGPGTAVNMAKRRQHKYGDDPDDRLASWHITIETDGSIVQQLPLNRVGYHAGSTTAKPVPGLGWANQHTVGIELVGDGSLFTEPQVATACAVWRALVQAYGIARQFAMITHQSIDPERREDPGPVWMGQYAQRVLDAAYGP